MAPPTTEGVYGATENVTVAAEMKTLPRPNMLDADEFRRQGHQVIDLIADYYGGIGDYPVHPNVTPGFLRNLLPAEAPSCPEPEAFSSALRDVRDLILPGMTHWQSPRHMAHFPASSSTVGALGEALAAGINAVPFTWAASPAATELEMVVVDWLGKALQLPESLLFAGGGGGTLMGTSWEAILCAVVAARDRKLAQIGAGRIGDLAVYCSDQTHFAFRKAARIAGIRREHCREIPTWRADMLALSPADLHAAMQADVDARFEVAAERIFALVCFRLRSPEQLGGDKASNALNRGLLEDVNAVASGPYMSSANVGGVYMLRCAIGSTLTEERHVKDAWKVVQERASAILAKMEILYAPRG